MMENTITISQERYDELVKAESQMQFLRAYVTHEVYTSADILYYLGIKNEEKSDEIS
jgi:predicted TPR repeat methyltransferase